MARKPRLIYAMEYRIKWLSEWLEMRNYSLREEREVFLCIMYSTAKVYLVDEAAQEKIIQINYSLTLPFSREKLQKHIFDSVDKRKRRLKYSNEKIKDILKITDEEYAALDPNRAKREKEELKKRNNARNERNNEIISLYQHGVPKMEIARRFDISKKTVQRIINKHQEKQERDARDFIGTYLTISSSSEDNSAIANSDEQKMAKLFLRSYKEKMESEGCDEQLKALEVWTNTKSNLLILGSAGTGKTTLAKEYLKTLSKKDRAKVLVVAPTWKAVTNLSGTTVHRAFELSCSIQQDTPIEEVPKALKNIDTIIIDEISMLRVDVFNRMVQIIRYTEQQVNHPIRIIAIGDFGQLAPVCVGEDKDVLEQAYTGVYCYDSPLWESLDFQKIVLHQVHRQEDKKFADHLQLLKYGCKSVVEWFNDNCCTGFSYDAITICPTNELVKEYTERYVKENWHYCFDTYEAEYDGSLTDELPVDKNIQLGLCRIMFLWNGKQYKRGDFAMIESFSDDGIDVTMEKTGERIQVQRETWTLTNGTKYTQYPMCLACAITVHKAQGCTFDEVNIDRGNGFWMPGQLYVAMSRCRTPYGIHLVKPLKEKDVHADCDGDVEVGFTLHENARTHATEFVSDGEVTENFVRLLAKLFGKDFPVKKTAKKLKIDGFYLEDVRDDDYCDENGVFMAKCFVGNDVQDEEDEADILANIELLAKVMNAEAWKKQGMSEEEIKVKQKEALDEMFAHGHKMEEKHNYAEFYVHIDLDKKQIGFSQKSAGYQLPILRMLTGTPAKK